ncbi:N-acetyltransferase [Niallia endozanthoxylica]|uniref:N-acetyltransferase n=1 Tax=Niallia endozanthoxylica TaxID=2036016 RepID=A0A5J5HT14_9BACI|nr:N-acetyltransferase [Niallia endozanthoxylica]KAA9025730.1 N-acetyltransferase [Niallia endozanthoxylica]
MVEIRRAKISDIDRLHELINIYSEKEILLPRTKESLYQNIFSIFVAEKDGEVIGSASLTILDKELAEIRSLVVDTSALKMGIGRMLVEKIVEETKRLGIEKLISLTYQVEFFEKCGFEITVKDNMPQKVWKDCITCPKLHHCDEIAMIMYVKDNIFI